MLAIHAIVGSSIRHILPTLSATKPQQIAPVRHQSIWNRWIAKLTECLAHHGFHIMRRLCGVASAVV